MRSSQAELYLILMIGCLIWQPTRLHSEERDSPSVYQAATEAMESGGLARSQQILQLHLHVHKRDEHARFQLGMIQFLRAVENLGRGLYDYGLRSGGSNTWFVRLPVPENENPSEISYPAFLRLIDSFRQELLAAERNLALVNGDKVKVPFQLSQVVFQFAHPDDERITLSGIIEGGRQFGINFSDENPELLIKFDRGDVAWLRAYCHLLAGVVDFYHAFHSADWFDTYAKRFFPRVKPMNPFGDGPALNTVVLRDPNRLHEFRKHLMEVCRLNAETWRYIHSERDDDYEWLSHPGQTDQLGMTLTEQQIDSWLELADYLEEILSGERLIPSAILKYMIDRSEEGLGLNVAKLLDEPPANLNWERITDEGINAKYLEPEDGRKLVDVMMLIRVISQFNGPFGVSAALRLN